jgi:preprotein translocase subunit SecY
MISAFFNIRKIPDLRNRVVFTILLLIVVRLGSFITCPGVRPDILDEYLTSQMHSGDGGGVAQMFNIFSGGALTKAAIFSLGVLPYISASIMIQLLTAVVPQLGKLAREEGGRQKVMLYTRYTTVVLCIIQGFVLARQLVEPTVLFSGIDKITAVKGDLVSEPGFLFYLSTVVALTAGSLFVMWLGDQITERGIGNGMSLIISVGIVSQLPAACIQAWKTVMGTADTASTPIKLVVLVAFLLLVIAGVICITQGQRRIAIQYAKRQVGRKSFGGTTTYLPLKVNYSGVMPIIFAQALLTFPAFVIRGLAPTNQGAAKFADLLQTGWLHYVLYAVLIFVFSYFWVATQFQPQQIADDLKRSGGYIPGQRPGQPTADFLDRTMTRLTFAGAVFLTAVAILPETVSRLMQIPPMAAQFFGGSSMLIVVGVALDTMRQIETHLLSRHYDGFLRKGRLRARYEGTPAQRAEAASNQAILWLSVAAAVVVIAAIVAMLSQGWFMKL